jgi:hypothetical protein
MDNCWISCQVMADMKKVYDDLMIINLYISPFWPFDIAKKSPRLQATSKKPLLNKVNKDYRGFFKQDVLKCYSDAIWLILKCF